MKKITILSMLVVVLFSGIYLGFIFYRGQERVNDYKKLVGNNRQEVHILKEMLLNVSGVKFDSQNQISFSRDINPSRIIERTEFREKFPNFHKYGLKVAFLFPESQCILLSENEYISYDLLLCNNAGLDNNTSDDNVGSLLGNFVYEDENWYVLKYHYM